jgi:FHA domain/Bacterial regulatory proteins, luxR family
VSFSSHSLSPAELASLVDAERKGGAFLAYRDGTGDLRLGPLDGLPSATIGRSQDNDFVLAWDAEVSRTHAQLELIGGEWTLTDDGLSRNGSFVNGERIAGRRRLADGDVMRLGSTSVVFRAPASPSESTAVAGAAAHIRLTDGERRVLVALCRPMAVAGSSAVPAGNKEIAAELNLTSDGVKTHVRALFAKLGIEDLPQYRKRTELARRALELGIVTQRDL